jgi:hypothetical protein
VTAHILDFKAAQARRNDAERAAFRIRLRDLSAYEIMAPALRDWCYAMSEGNYKAAIAAAERL